MSWVLRNVKTLGAEWECSGQTFYTGAMSPVLHWQWLFNFRSHLHSENINNQLILALHSVHKHHLLTNFSYSSLRLTNSIVMPDISFIQQFLKWEVCTDSNGWESAHPIPWVRACFCTLRCPLTCHRWGALERAVQTIQLSAGATTK